MIAQTVRRSLFAICCMALFIGVAGAQTQTFWGKSLTLIKNNVQLGGMASAQSEGYYSHGIEARQPTALGRLMLTPSLTVLNLMSISADLLLSTEGSHARQDLNILGLHPSWSWGRADVGDFSNSFSKYSFNGVGVRGAGVDLYPAWLRLDLAGGQTRRAVQGDATIEAYAQYLGAGKIGYLAHNGSYVDLIFLKAKDDIHSLRKTETIDSTRILADTLTTDLDTIWLKPPPNPYAVTPQDNVVGGLSTRINLLRSRLTVDLEACGSAFTKDITAEEVPSDSITKNTLAQHVIDAVTVPRRSTVVDAAVNTDVKLNLSMVNFEVGYNFVGPGYFSLGVPTLSNDRQEILANTSFKLGTTRISLGWNRLLDNLMGQKLNTNTRDQIRGSVAAMVGKWQSQYNGTYLTMSSDASVDSLKWTYDNVLASTYQGIVFGRENIIRQAGLQYSFQTSNKDMYASAQNAQYHTASLSGSALFAKAVGLSASVGLSLRNPETSDIWELTQVYSLRLSYAAFKNRLNNSLYASSSMIRDTRMITAGFNSGLSFTQRDNISLNITYNIFRGTQKFEELRGGLSLTHQL
jgi:hypothetical protein